MFVRSCMEYNAVVWHSSLSDRNRNDLERIQELCFQMILSGFNRIQISHCKSWISEIMRSERSGKHVCR